MKRFESMRRILVWVVAGLMAVGCFVAYQLFLWPMTQRADLPPRPPLIAHGGGMVQGVKVSNTLEALDQNYQTGFRYFELDFSWTPNGDLVAFHDWGRTFENAFGSGTDRPDTAEAFLTLKRGSGLTSLDVKAVRDWMLAHPDAHLVTDIKEDNLGGLRVIQEELEACLDRVIPQIYEPEEYAPVSALGYRRIIYTIYRSRKNLYQVIRSADRTPFFAITVPISRVKRYGLARRIQRLGKVVYAHTVNEVEQAEALVEAGVHGFYTDSLTLEQMKAIRASQSP